jgi:hypothetical protein
MNADDTPQDQADAMAELQARATALEKQLRDVEAQAAEKLRQAELKAEAVRAGIVDVDGLRLLDAQASVGDAAEVIGKLRRDKPWLFAAGSSSSGAAPPPAAPLRRKLATEMSVEEWRAARADLLRRR